MKSKVIEYTGELQSKIVSKGIEYEKGAILFPTNFSDDLITEMAAKLSRPESIYTPFSSYTPKEEELNKVKNLLGKNQDMEGLQFYRSVSSSTRMHRRREVFSKEFLTEMAKQYEASRPFSWMHSDSWVLGRTFQGKRVKHPEQEGEYSLLVNFYLIPNIKLPNGLTVEENMSQGLYREVSTAFMGFVAEYVPADEKENPYGIDFYRYVEVGSVLHLSLVAFGNQPDNVLFNKTDSGTGVTFGPVKKREPVINLNFGNMEKFELEGTEIKFNLAPDIPPGVLDTIKQNWKKVQDLVKKQQEEIEKHQAAQETQQAAKVEQFVSLRKQVDPDANAEEARVYAKALLTGAPDLFTKELGELQTKAILLKNGGLNPNPAQEAEEEKPGPTGTYIDKWL